MPTYVVDPLSVQAEGVILDWNIAGRRLGIGTATGADAYARTVQLRWMLDAGLGLPTEPFQVWTRAHTAQAGYGALTLTQRQLFAAGTLISWSQGSVSSVILNITASSAGTVMAFGGSPVLDNLLALQSIAAGATSVQISGHCINFLLVSAGITINSATGLSAVAYANSAGWAAVELVGLPVTTAAWGGIGRHGEPQGMVGAFTDAVTAATQRLSRGAPPFGWAPTIATGVPAPAWVAPNSTLLLGDVNSQVLQYLHDIAKTVVPKQQAAATISVALPAPVSSTNGPMKNKPGTTTTMVPLPMTYMAASSDPFLNLALGFGTAYNAAKPGTTVAMVYDYMITAHWANGLDGKSAPLDYAALVIAPAAAGAPATPANPATEILGALRPPTTDGDWQESVRLSWDRPVAGQLLRTASCAAARVSTAPAAPAFPLMQPRKSSGGYQPIVLGGSINYASHPDPEPTRVNVMDREIDIPFNPGSRALLYGVATQDIYGQWSPWTTANATIAQPALEPVRLSNPKLTPIAPANGSVCQTTLDVDITWDWRVRRPQQITLFGRMFAAATHGTPAPAGSPSGLDRSLGGGGAALVLTFIGDTPTAPGATITPLSEDGQTILTAFDSGQGTNRRYRVSLSGLQLDFGSTPFIGMALWAQGKERIAPNRVTPFSDTTPATPLVTSTGDPRPPVVPVYHVALGSMPDATGSSHVQVSWTPQPNALGYFIYEALESNLRVAWGLPEPGQTDTLDTRATLIHDQFKTNPVRRPFHRWNSTLLTSTGTDITLPRGSTAIHVYVVLGVSAGQIESNWPVASPTADNSIIAVAAPHITRPTAPTIEVHRVLDNSVSPPVYKANLQINTRPGPRAAMVEIYRVRVDDAARELDTMGPPLARLTATSGAWTVTTTPDPLYGPYISAVQGTDAPTGSWKRVWYRAAAWTAQDDTRGGLPGRSDPSNAAWVVLPPATGPTLSTLSLSTGPTPPDVIVQWTCDAPVKKTPLGPHKISVRASTPGAAAALVTLDSTLDALPQAEPATGSGVWLVSTAAGVTTYRAILRRTSINDVVNFAVRVTDPLGRSASQNLAIAAGSVDPPPDLGNLVLKQITLPLPAHSVLTFTSSSPVVSLPDGAYKLTVTEVTGIVIKLLATPTQVTPILPTPVLPTPVLPTPVLPKPIVPAPIIPTPVTPAPILPTPIVPTPIIPRPASVSMPLGSVPTRPPLGTPPALYVIRSPAGPAYTYTAVASAAVKGFTVRITGPDGTFVEKTT